MIVDAPITDGSRVWLPPFGYGTVGRIDVGPAGTCALVTFEEVDGVHDCQLWCVLAALLAVPRETPRAQLAIGGRA